MLEKLVIVPRKVTTGEKMVTIVVFAAACLFMLLATFVSVDLFLLPAITAIILWAWRGFFSNIEYEYTYYNGELRFAKITNKARRKNIAEINMEEVIILAPKGDRGVYQYENDKNLKCKNLTSKDAQAKVYELIAKGEKGVIRYEIEPDEEMLNAIRERYSRVVKI